MLNYTGLRKKESYNEILNYIQTDQTIIKYPNRKATFLMNTPQYSSLMELDDLDDQEEAIKKAKVIESLAPTRLERHIATTSSGSGNDWTPGTAIFGPAPAPSRSLLD